MPVTLRIEVDVPNIGRGADRLAPEIANTLESDVAGLLSKALRKRSANWSTSPRWNARVKVGGTIMLTLLPTGPGEKKWRWVSGGTKPHFIFPRRKKYLVFQGGYSAKTAPGGTYGKSGKYSGDLVFALGVDHPGIAARGFEFDVVDEEEDKVVAAINAAITRAISV